MLLKTNSSGILKRNMENEKLTKLYEEYVKSDFAIKKAREYLREAEKIGDIKYFKPLDDFRARDERDLFAHVALHHVGVKFVVRKENAPRGYTNVDLKIWGRLWELKSPTAKPKADGRIRFVNSNIAKANKQFKNHYPVPIKNYRIIFSNRYTGFDDEIIISEVKKEVKRLNVKECLYIDKKGNVIKIA